MNHSFLDILRKRLGEHAATPADSGGPAAQGVRPTREYRSWDFAFATV